MSKRSILRLIGAVRIAEQADGLGLPLLNYGSSNDCFIAECDEDLAISAFTRFDSFDDYKIEYGIESLVRNRMFEIGDPIPIPYWTYGQLNFVMGDETPRGWRRLWGNGFPDIGQKIDDLLESARTGALREARRNREGEVIRATFKEVFFSEPNYSRYWTSRFGLAVKQLLQMDNPARSMREELKAKATKWVIEYLRKSDFIRISTLLGRKGESVFDKSERSELLYAYFLHKLATKEFAQVEPYVRHPLVVECFPKGINDYYQKHGWPVVKVKSERPRHILVPMFDAIHEADKWEFNKNEWVRAEAMAALMFGNSPAPRDIQRLVEPIIDHTRMELKSLVDHNPQLRHNFWTLSRKNPLSREYQDKWSTLLAMTGVVSGEDRMVQHKAQLDFESILKELEADERFYFPSIVKGDSGRD